MELGMAVWVVLSGQRGQVAASPRGGKWLIRLDDGVEARLSADEVIEILPTEYNEPHALDGDTAYLKWLERNGPTAP